MGTQQDPLVAEVVVSVPPRLAFVAFTAQMGEWWDPMLTPDPATFTGVEIDPDGDVAMQQGEDRQVWGRVTAWEPPHRYRQDFWLGHSQKHPTILTVTFTEEDGGTRVRLEHGGWSDATADVREKYGHWQDLLRRYAGHAVR